LVLKGPLFGGTEMPKEVKKEGCTSECIRPLLPPGVASRYGVWKGSWVASSLGEASLRVCPLFPWKDQPSVASTWGLPCRSVSLFPSPRLVNRLAFVNGLAFAFGVCACAPVSLSVPKWSLAFGVRPFIVGCSASGWVSLLRLAGDFDGSDISWSLRSLLVGLLGLETCAMHSVCGFAWRTSCEKVRGGASGCRCVRPLTTAPLNLGVRWSSWGRLWFTCAGCTLGFVPWSRSPSCARL
jgi:hypothetical protein